jgi:hypothetical protein
MTPVTFFKDIGAKYDLQFSWGAVAPNGDVILCAWRHHARPVANAKDKWRVRVSGVNPHNLRAGMHECAQKIKMVAKGTPGYLVMCSKVDGVEALEYATSFEKNYLYIMEHVSRIGDYWYATIDSSDRGRISVDEIANRQGKTVSNWKELRI